MRSAMGLAIALHVLPDSETGSSGRSIARVDGDRRRVVALIVLSRARRGRRRDLVCCSRAGCRISNCGAVPYRRSTTLASVFGVTLRKARRRLSAHRRARNPKELTPVTRYCALTQAWTIFFVVMRAVSAVDALAPSSWVAVR